MNHVKSRVISKVAKRGDVITSRISVRLREDFDTEPARYAQDIMRPGLLPPGRALAVRGHVFTDEPTLFEVVDLTDNDIEGFTYHRGLFVEELAES